MAEMSLTRINTVLSKPFSTTKYLTEIIECAILLLEEIEQIKFCPSQASTPDDLRPILNCMRQDIPVELDVLFSKLLKYFLTKSVNWAGMGSFGIKAIVTTLDRQGDGRTLAAPEICSVVVNSCYDVSNAQLFIDEGGLPRLFLFLRGRDPKLLSSALGAVQVLCVTPTGRQLLRQDRDVRKSSD